MDPNTALAALRDFADHRLAALDPDRLIELFAGLDEWLSKGGFPPDAWARA